MDLKLKQLGGPLPNRVLTDKDTYRIGKQVVQWEKDFPILEKKKEKSNNFSVQINESTSQ